MEKGRRIFSVQDDLDTLKVALEKIKNTDNNILVTNCIARLKLGSTKFHTTFNTALYNDDNNMLIVLKDNSEITPEIFRELLDSKNVNYNELSFIDYIHYKKPETSKELFFASNSSSFAKAIDTSKEKGINSCKYYPKVKGHFTIKYYYDRRMQEQLDDYYIKGVLELDDKFILIVDNRDDYSMYFKKILHNLETKGMEVELDYSDEIIEPLTEKKVVKQYERN